MPVAQFDAGFWSHDVVQLFGVRPSGVYSSIELFDHVHDRNQVTLGCLNNCGQVGAKASPMRNIIVHARRVVTRVVARKQGFKNRMHYTFKGFLSLVQHHGV